MPKTRAIAFLRGINLAANRRVSMPALRDLLADLGYTDVRTHLQSGNVLLTSSVSPATLERRLRREIASGLGIDVPVLVRTRDELARVVALNPLGDVADDLARYIVTFLSAKPSSAVVRRLATEDVAPERLVIKGREAYTWRAGGSQRSRAAKLLSDERLGVTGTSRNWKTVTKLLELADE